MEPATFICNPYALAAAALTLILATRWIKFFGEEFLKMWRTKKRYHPVAATLLGHVLHFRRLHDYMTELARKHSTYRLLSFPRREVYTSDPANVEHLLKTNFENYGRGWYHYSVLSDLLGDGIFTVDGEKWRHQRKSASHEFSTHTLREFSSSIFKTNAVKLAKVLSESAVSNEAFEVQDLLMRSTLDSVFKIILGVELDSLFGAYDEGIQFCKAFDMANEITFQRYVDVFWRIRRFLNIGSEKELKESIKVIDRFVYKIIQTKTEEVSKSEPQMQDPMKKGDILSRFLELNQTDPKYLKDIILSFMIAGKDTTASTLCWFLYMLCKHPELQVKVAAEIIETIQIDDQMSIDQIAERINEDALGKMQYLHAALTETLRLYPAVPVDGKLCFSDDTFPDGFCVKKGDSVSFQPYAMGRMERLWGNDAAEFRPERWLNADGQFQPESSFKFTAFQAGPRICLGKEFAYRQMKIFSAVLLGSYRFKLSNQNKPVNYRVMLTLHMEGGLHLQAFPRFNSQKDT